jgi:hypothetical protein
MNKINAIVNCTTNKIYAMKKHSTLGDTKCVLDNYRRPNTWSYLCLQGKNYKSIGLNEG